MANMERGERITTKQAAAIRALLAGASHGEAAAAAGVNGNRITVWKREPAFAAALQAAEGEAMQSITLGLLALAERATSTLEELLTAEDTRDMVRLRAAEVVIDKLLHIRELVDLEARLAALEAGSNG